MKRILFITTRLIYPTNDGRKVVLYNYCKGLVEKFNCEVRLYSILSNNEAKFEQPKFISKVYYAHVPGGLEKVKNILIKSIILKKWPLQISIYYCKKTKKDLDKIIENYNPDIVICDMARTAEYVKDLDGSKINKILDMDDLLSKRYSRQIDSGRISSTSIGSYAEKLPSVLRKLTYNKMLIKQIIKMEAKLLNKYEIYISKYFKNIVFVSYIEARELNEKINSNKCIDITIGVDYEYFSTKVAKEKKENYIVFLGNMYVAHNIDCVESFIKDIFPIVLDKIPNCILRIVGKCSNEYKEKMRSYSNIEVTGEVQDIRKYVQECNILITPFVYGSGIKTKVLESMAMGVAVITNKIGAEGLRVSNGKELIIEEDNNKIALQIVNLLQNKKIKDKICNEARQFIQDKHQWNNILEKFTTII